MPSDGLAGLSWAPPSETLLARNTNTDLSRVLAYGGDWLIHRALRTFSNEVCGSCSQIIPNTLMTKSDELIYHLLRVHEFTTINK